LPIVPRSGPRGYSTIGRGPFAWRRLYRSFTGRRSWSGAPAGQRQECPLHLHLLRLLLRVLRSLKSHPEPASMVVSPFWQASIPRLQGVWLCTKRCQMEALHLNNKKAVLDAGRCIGCGLCVTTCPTHRSRWCASPSEAALRAKDIIETILDWKSSGKTEPGQNDRHAVSRSWTVVSI